MGAGNGGNRELEARVRAAMEQPSGAPIVGMPDQQLVTLTAATILGGSLRPAEDGSYVGMAPVEATEIALQLTGYIAVLAGSGLLTQALIKSIAEARQRLEEATKPAPPAGSIIAP